MSKIQLNFILNSKGGIGKSFIAYQLANYYITKGITPICYDTDKTNPTFSKYKEALNAQWLNLLNNGKEDIDLLKNLIMDFQQQKINEPIIIDNGANSWEAISKFLINEASPVMNEIGCQLIIHNVITGEESVMNDIIAETIFLIENLSKDTQFVLWENEHNGAVVSPVNGLSFTETDKYKEIIKPRLIGKIIIPDVPKNEPNGRSYKKMMDLRLIPSQADKSPKLDPFDKIRIKKIDNEINKRIDKVLNKEVNNE